jgi:hypothetical protein
MNARNCWLDGCGNIIISARGRSIFLFLPASLASNYLWVHLITQLLLTTISWLHLQAVRHKYDHHMDAQRYMWPGPYMHEIVHTSCHQYGPYGLSLSNNRILSTVTHILIENSHSHLVCMLCTAVRVGICSPTHWDWFAILRLASVVLACTTSHIGRQALLRTGIGSNNLDSEESLWGWVWSNDTTTMKSVCEVNS